MKSAELDAREAVARLTALADYSTPLAIRALNDLGVYEALAAGPRTAEELAEQTGANAPRLYRMLRALCGHDLFTEDRQGRFTLTPLSEAMLAGHPHSLKQMLQFIPQDVEAWLNIGHALRTNEDTFKKVTGETYWDHMRSNSRFGEQVETEIWGMTELELAAVLPAYDWGSIDTLVDLGGGTGQVMAALLQTAPNMRGILLDLPDVAPHSLPVLIEAGVADRCEIVSGDFFAAVPENADAYLLKRVFYDFSDDEAVAILRQVRKAMRPDSRVLTLDGLARPDNRLDVGKSHDMFILPLGHGRCRSRKELGDLFAAADLRITRVIPTGIFPLVEGRAA
jgi:SAM-dependent methyltransferase